MTLDLTDDKACALTKHLRRTLGDDPFPLAPRLDLLKAIVGKLEPPKPEPVRPPPLKVGAAPSVVGRGRRSWRG